MFNLRFSIKINILNYFFLNEEQQVHVNGLARIIGEDPKNVHRILLRLQEEGILCSEFRAKASSRNKFYIWRVIQVLASRRRGEGVLKYSEPKPTKKTKPGFPAPAGWHSSGCLSRCSIVTYPSDMLLFHTMIIIPESPPANVKVIPGRGLTSFIVDF